MMLFTVILAVVSACLTVASPPISHSVVHEARSALPEGWSVHGIPSPHARLPLRLGLAQRNLDRLDEFLMDVADPKSPNFGKHWSPTQVAAAFSPAQESVDFVRNWLSDLGIAPGRVRVSPGRGWLEINTTVAEAEQLLDTKYNVYTHESGAARVGCDKYHLPEHIMQHVDLVTPTVHFDTKIHQRDSPHFKHNIDRKIGAPQEGTVFPKAVRKGNPKKVLNAAEPTDCDSTIIPACLRALYKMDYAPAATDRNSFGVVEYTPQAYIKADLAAFYLEFEPELVGKYPTLASIDGGRLQTKYLGFDYNGESALDLVYAQSLVGQQNVTLYQVGDMIIGASLNDFLDALDGSYCAGDDPVHDGVYPDTRGTEQEGAYKGPKDCGTHKAAYVISTSYGHNEADLSPTYTSRQCAEYAKLGLLGTTFIFSSGDYGVAGNDKLCLNEDGSQTKTGKRFNPGFPSSCPYVTSVGGTQILAGNNLTEPEVALFDSVYSGGGFSNNFARPSYQNKVVGDYFTSSPPSHPATTYNRAGRGFPDISANGANYLVPANNDYFWVFGTSASAPVVGAIISNINDARLAAGKGPLGFINPALYSAEFAGAFNDITSGSNPGCETRGFTATSGWDPVTGLGTPNFPVLLEKFLALP